MLELTLLALFGIIIAIVTPKVMTGQPLRFDAFTVSLIIFALGYLSLSLLIGPASGWMVVYIGLGLVILRLIITALDKREHSKPKYFNQEV